MSIQEIVLENSPSKTKPQLHLVNCSLSEETSNAKVSEYFTSQLQFQSNKTNANQYGSKNLQVSFRGRPLNGKKVTLPEQYTFARVTSSSDEIDNKKKKNENKVVVASDLTDEITYWNLDKIPGASDVIPQALQWLQLSADIHSHVQLEDE